MQFRNKPKNQRTIDYLRKLTKGIPGSYAFFWYYDNVSKRHVFSVRYCDSMEVVDLEVPVVFVGDDKIGYYFYQGDVTETQNYVEYSWRLKNMTDPESFLISMLKEVIEKREPGKQKLDVESYPAFIPHEQELLVRTFRETREKSIIEQVLQKLMSIRSYFVKGKEI